MTIHRRTFLAGTATVATSPVLAGAKGDPAIKGLEIKCPARHGLVVVPKKAMVEPSGQIIVTDLDVYLPNAGTSFMVINISRNPITVHAPEGHVVAGHDAADFQRRDGEWRQLKAL